MIGHPERRRHAFPQVLREGVAETPSPFGRSNEAAIAVCAGGAVKAFKTTPLLSPEEGLEALKKAGSAGYRPPGG